MKRTLVGVIFVLMIGLVGCNQSTQKSNLNIMSSNEAEKVIETEYISRMKRSLKSTLYDYEENGKYYSMYKDKEICDEVIYGRDKERYKYFIEDISTFRTENE